MKKLIILPGNSPKNKMWGEAMASQFGSLFDSVYVQNYDHWISGADTINFETEAEKLREVVLENRDDVYTILAKSFGSILALQSMYKGFISPKQCIFFGLPLNLVQDQNIFNGNWSFLSSLTTPSLAFHNIDDPIANYDFALAKITELKLPIYLIPMEGNTHGYDIPELYNEAIVDFLNE